MSKLPWALTAIVIIAGIAFFVSQKHATAELQTQVATLTQQNQEVTRLRAENQRLKQAPPRPAAPSIATRPAGNPFSPAGSKPNAPKIALAPGLVPLSTLAHAGRATPRAAWATQLWAAANGDVNLEASAITFGPEERAKLAALLPTLPESVRDTYNTPELLLAFALTGSPHPVGGMEILGETDVDANDVTLQTQWQHADDTLVHQNDVQLQQAADGWKMVVPMSIVERATAYLSRNAAAK